MMGLVPTRLATNVRAFVSIRRLHHFFRAFALLMGGVHTWAAMISHSMNADGISYLDIGDAYMRGDWEVAINSVWSPLYSWILGPVMAVFKPPMQWEFPLVHLVNFVIYVGTLLCFEYFWRQVRNFQQDRLARSADRISWPEWAWWTLGYLLFIWSSLTLIEIWAVTPDMLMAGLVYVAAGLIICVRLGNTDRKTFLILGIMLGLSYLAKAIMFPLSFVFLVAALFSTNSLSQAFPRVLTALLSFLIVALPFILLISKAAGKLTFGEAGAITYVRYVNGVSYPHWQGGPPGNGTPVHPSRQIFEPPPIYEFGTPILSTYPISLNPIYWYQGIEAHFDFAQQLRLLTASVLFYLDLFFHQLGGVIAGVFILNLVSRREKVSVKNFLCSWGLVIPALAGLSLYALVLVEGRYIGVFVVLLLADLLSNVSLPDNPIFKRLTVGIAGIMALMLLVNLVAFNLQGFADLNRNRGPVQSTNPITRPPSWPGEVAEELNRLGIQPGDPVAVIGYAFDSFWARLARVRIVAEMLGVEADPFWTGGPSLQTEVIQAFTSTGAKAIVAEDVPQYATLAGWSRVNDTDYYIYLTR